MQSKTLSMVPGTNGFEIWFSQGDVGVTRELQLKDRDGNFFEIPSGSTVKIAGTKPSGLGFNETVSWSGHTVTITASAEMTDEVGFIECELKITKTGLKMGSANGHLGIEKDPHPDNTTDGMADVLVPVITALVERVEAAVAKEEVLHEAEAWAVGKRDGVDVPSTDDTYHNNSKWYSDQAALAKTAASASEQTASQKASQAASSAADAATAKTNAETAKTAAEAAAAAAAAVFDVVGSVSFTVDPDDGHVTMWFTEEEES